MEKRVLSTFKILKEKAFNTDIDGSWIDWSIEMIQSGYETDSLYELAGISKPYNQFELQDLTNKVLKDLNLDFSNIRKTLKNYAYFLIQSNLENPENYFNVLKEFRDIYYELDMDKEYQDFAFLYWAKEDLNYGDNQHYWDGADATNIDKIIKEKFQLYVKGIDNEIKNEAITK